jgi:hypothetical protein
VGKKRRVMGLPPSVRAGAGGCVALRGWVRSARSLRLVCSCWKIRADPIRGSDVSCRGERQDRRGTIRIFDGQDQNVSSPWTMNAYIYN